MSTPTEQFHRSLNSPPSVAQPDEEPISVAFLPYVGSIFNRNSRFMSRHIKSVGHSQRKISSVVRSDKDDRGLQTPQVCSITCEFCRMGRSFDTRVKEYQQHIRLEHPSILAVSEQIINLRHCI
jgi:hypothetical protein